MNQEVYEYMALRQRQKMMELTGLVLATIGVLYSFTILNLRLAGPYTVGALLIVLFATAGCAIQRQAMYHDGFCRKLIERKGNKFDYPPLSDWHTDLIAREAFDGGGEFL
jgi:hypothetical protein